MDAIGYLVGAGSMTLGIEQAGFRVREVWETPGYAVNARSWDLNRPTLRHQVLELDHESRHFESRPVDLIYGNPPCGGVSTMGKAAVNNETNAGMRHWIRMVARGRPRAIIMESGYQLARPKFARLLLDLTNVLDDHGYWWWTWSFYSYQLGTPQRRQRMFLCASLEEPRRLDLIESLADLPKTTTVAPCGPWLELVDRLPPSPQPIELKDGRVIHQHYWDTTGTRWNEHVAAFLARGAQDYVTPKQLKVFERAVEKATDEVARAKAERELARAHRICWKDCPDSLNISQFFKRLTLLDLAEPAPTMIGLFRFVHPIRKRLLTMREMATLMGYPITWQFHRLDPHYAIQGVPAQNARWVASRLLAAVGGLDGDRQTGPAGPHPGARARGGGAESPEGSPWSSGAGASWAREKAPA